MMKICCRSISRVLPFSLLLLSPLCTFFPQCHNHTQSLKKKKKESLWEATVPKCKVPLNLCILRKTLETKLHVVCIPEMQKFVTLQKAVNVLICRCKAHFPCLCSLPSWMGLALADNNLCKKSTSSSMYLPGKINALGGEGGGCQPSYFPLMTLG